MPSSVAVQQARNAFKKGSSAQQVAERLAQLAIRRYTTDNVAVVVVDLGTLGAGRAAEKTPHKFRRMDRRCVHRLLLP